MMNKAVFLQVIDFALATKRGIRVEVVSHDLPASEVITNPHANLIAKRDYYTKAYDDQMRLKNNLNIRIVRAERF